MTVDTMAHADVEQKSTATKQLIGQLSDIFARRLSETKLFVDGL